MEPSRPFPAVPSSATRWLTVAAIVATLAACVTPTTRQGAAPPVSPLRLVSAAPFELPVGCVATGGTVYRTTFDVDTDGRVTNAVSTTGDGCVEIALRRWVATFRYQPVPERAPVAFDWLVVTAVRGT